MKTCEHHSGIEEKFTHICADVRELKADVKAMMKKIYLWIGVITCLTALPAIMKLWGLFETAAHAIGD